MNAAMSAAPTSLVLLERDGAGADSWVLRRAASAEGHCPRWPFDYLNLTTGAMWPASCKSIRCEVCGPRESRRRAWRVAKAGPERFLTLTMLPDDYQRARKLEAVLLRSLRGEGLTVEWAIAHELTKRGVRHAHALVRGDFLPQALVSRYAERAGMGYVVDIRAVRGSHGAASYALKESLRVVGYATKGTAALDDHLALNGGRVCRTTRGYFKP